jgi:hypothetical protein
MIEMFQLIFMESPIGLATIVGVGLTFLVYEIVRTK